MASTCQEITNKLHMCSGSYNKNLVLDNVGLRWSRRGGAERMRGASADERGGMREDKGGRKEERGGGMEEGGARRVGWGGGV